MSKAERTMRGPWDFSSDTTLPRVLAANARTLGDAVALREKDRGIWQQTTWSQWLEQVLCCAAGLEALGFVAGDALLTVGDNRPHLYTGMLAAGALRGFAMPVYPDAAPDEVRHSIQASEVRFVLAEDQEQVDKILDLRESCPSIVHVVYDDPRGLGAYQAPGLLSWARLQELGAERLQREPTLRQQLMVDAFGLRRHPRRAELVDDQVVGVPSHLSAKIGLPEQLCRPIGH